MQSNKFGGPYQFTTNENREDLSSGRVIYGVTGATNFPVRLIEEMFLRADNILGGKSPYTIYDPFCGSGYSLTVLGFIYPEMVDVLIASDINSDILDTARKNLALLTQTGLEKRSKELKELQDKFQKVSHKEALESVGKLARKLKPGGIPSTCFELNVLKDKSEKDLKTVDIVIADIPYGKLAQWQGSEEGINPVQAFLDNIKMQLRADVLIVLSSNKKQEVQYGGFNKVKSFKVGTRKILFLRPE